MNEYGPQTEEIKTFLERVRELTPEQIEGLNTVSNVAWLVAHNTACDAISDDAYEAISDAVWDAVRHAVWNAVRYPDWSTFPYVLSDIALALAVKDKISEEHFSILYGPWNSVMEK